VHLSRSFMIVHHASPTLIGAKTAKRTNVRTGDTSIITGDAVDSIILYSRASFIGARFPQKAVVIFRLPGLSLSLSLVLSFAAPREY